MSTQWIDFKELRAKLRIEDVLRLHGVAYRQKGNQASAFCPLPDHPQHEGKKRSPSFSAHLGRGLWQCFSCGARGNAVELDCRLRGLNPDNGGDLRRSALDLIDDLAIQPDEKPTSVRKAGTGHNHNGNGRVLATPARSQAEGGTARANTQQSTHLPVVINPVLDFELKRLDPSHPYFHDRGIDPATIEYFGLGFCDRGMLKGRIAIPLHDADGKLVGYAGRLVEEDQVTDDHPRYLFPGSRERNGQRIEFHKSRVLYNLHRIERPVETLVLVEGFTHVWWLHQHGCKHAVAMMGASLSAEQLDLILGATTPDARIVVLPDGDPAGVRAGGEIVALLAPHRFVRLVRLEADQQPTDLDRQRIDSILGNATQ